MSLLVKLISGDKKRRSRLHDEKGNFAGKNIAHIFPAVYSGVLRIVFGVRPELPWISYEGITILEKHLTSQSKVLEFGSGMSTLWYAKRASRVFSVESDKIWHEKISSLIAGENLNNVDLHYAEDSSGYTGFMSDSQEKFDLIMIDGLHRSLCADNAIKMLGPGGMLYLDNSDKHSSGSGGDLRGAEEAILAFAKKNGLAYWYITDFAPTCLFVSQALIVRNRLV